MKDLEKMYFNFIWKGKPDKVKRKLIIRNQNEGGFRAPDIRNIILSQKISWVKRLFNSDKQSNLNTLFCINISPQHKDFYEYSTKYINENVCTRRTNDFWKDVLKAWSSFVTQKGGIIKSQSDILTQPMWNNENIKVDNKTINYEQMSKSNIRWINDIIKEDGTFLNCTEVVEKYKCKTNFLQYAGIVQAIRTYCKRSNIKLDKKIMSPFIPYFLEDIVSKTKGCRVFYDILQESQSIRTLQQYRIKWERDLDNSFNEEEWKHINVLPFKSNLNSKAKWFQYSILHRFLPTNDLLHKMKIKDTNKCSFCKNETETICHMFYECPIVENILKAIKDWIEKGTQTKLNFSKSNVILGYPEHRNRVLNKILITVKHTIFKIKQLGLIPNITYIKNDLRQAYNIDKATAYSTCDNNQFTKFWSSCHLLFRD